jgi:hypothetical protein
MRERLIGTAEERTAPRWRRNAEIASSQSRELVNGCAFLMGSLSWLRRQADRRIIGLEST